MGGGRGDPPGKEALKHCRRVYGAFSKAQVDDAVRAHVPWTALRDLSQERVPEEARTRLLDEVCRGQLKASEIPSRIDQEAPDKPRQTHLPKNRVEVLNVIQKKIQELDRWLEGLSAPIRKALDDNESDARSGIAKVEKALDDLRRRWELEVEKAKKSQAVR